MPSLDDLHYFQSLPLDIKIAMTQTRLREWVNTYGLSDVFISFSGGKDSTVLLDIARRIYPDIRAIFADTGLEYPEIRRFVLSFPNVDLVRPKLTFKQVICRFGYPMISKAVSHNVSVARNNPDGRVFKNCFDENKHGQYAMFKWLPLLQVDFKISEKCCNYMKKKPTKDLKKYPVTATMAVESKLRRDNWLKNGCNAFECFSPVSSPMSFWTEQDVLQYIKYYNIPIASVYGSILYQDDNGQCMLNGCGKLCTSGCHRTGCIFCGFGAHLEKGEGRFERLKFTHPKLFDYCMSGGCYDSNGFWIPNNKGLGMAHVIDELCSLYGNDFIKY